MRDVEQPETVGPQGIPAFVGEVYGLGEPARISLEICHSRDPGNLERLAATLVALDARLRGVEDDVPFILDSRTLAAGDSFTFVTSVGNLDILATPAGTSGYDDLIRAATPMDLGDVSVPVVDVEDLIRMKRAAGRPKDLIEVEVLTAVRDELGR